MEQVMLDDLFSNLDIKLNDFIDDKDDIIENDNTYKFDNKSISNAKDKNALKDIKDNIVIIDIKNTDERKKLFELMEEGKVLIENKSNRPFIIAEQRTDIYFTNIPVIHKIYCDDIIEVSVRRYYIDLLEMPKGKRTLIKEKIIVYHKGYSIYSLITKEQLEYLIKNKYITKGMIYYAFCDMTTGISYSSNGDNEPTKEELEKYIEQLQSIQKTL